MGVIRSDGVYLYKQSQIILSIYNLKDSCIHVYVLVPLAGSILIIRRCTTSFEYQALINTSQCGTVRTSSIHVCIIVFKNGASVHLIVQRIKLEQEGAYIVAILLIYVIVHVCPCLSLKFQKFITIHLTST